MAGLFGGQEIFEKRLETYPRSFGGPHTVSHASCYRAVRTVRVLGGRADAMELGDDGLTGTRAGPIQRAGG